jgi:hypothetical protein
MKEGSGVRDQGSAREDQRSETRDQSAGNGERGSTLRRFAGPGLILLCAAFATAPEMVRGASCGHDFDFHLVSWFDTLNGWRHGIVYPHWTPSPNYGAGEPRFIFYPPLTWMAGALLGAVLPWRFVPLALTFLLLAAMGLATRALARQAFNDGIATLAGCTTIFSGYALFTAYERSAFAEMTGGFWVPLLLLLMLRDHTSPNSAGQAPASLVRRVLNGSTLPLTLVVAGAWLSNAPLGVMLSYLLAGVAIAVAVLARSWAPVLRAAAGAALGLGLAAFFLVPADWEQRWVDIRQAVDDPGLLIENSWLFARHADSRLELHDVELIRVSGIAVTMVAVALIGLAVGLGKRRLRNPRYWVPLALIPVVVLFLQIPWSEPVWNALPKLRFLQFPWRWLVVLEAPMAIFFAAAAWGRSRWWRAMVCAGCGMVFVIATGVAGITFFQTCDEEDAVPGRLADFQAGAGFEGTDEYAPPGADNSLVATNLPFACLVVDPDTVLGKGDPDNPTPDWSADQGSCDATFTAGHDSENRSAEHLRLQADAPHAGYLVLRLRTYPAWKVRVNGNPVATTTERQDGLMAVPVPRGHVDLAVDWTTTRDVVIGRWISVVALALVTGLGLVEYRRFRARLS